MTWASAPKIRSERIFILLHPLTVHERILSGGKGSACAASVDFLSVRRVCSLAGTIFSSGFLVVQPVTGKIPCVVRPALPVEFVARNPYAKALVNAMASVSRLRMRLSDLHVALLVTSVVKRTPSAGCPIPLLNMDNQRKDDR